MRTEIVNKLLIIVLVKKWGNRKAWESRSQRSAGYSKYVKEWREGIKNRKTCKNNEEGYLEGMKEQKNDNR